MKKKQPEIAIIGAGLAGLVLALALDKHCGIKSRIFEQAPRFDDGAGGAIGLYANGLRVVRDISPELLEKIRNVAFPYIYRRWMRHDGSEVACASENVLCAEEELQSVGCRRWKLQKVLCDATAEAGMDIQFGKRLKRVDKLEESGRGYTCLFEDGSSVQCQVIFGADGVKSRVRESMFSGEIDPQYTGITCLMGAASLPRPFRGICFPSSSTTKCHACYYPSNENETIFQIFFPTSERPETWGPLAPSEAKRECLDLAESLAKDGWHEDFIKPIQNADSVLRVGLRARSPLDKWVNENVVLLGDAAHPPVPYIGQGAMMAFEDAGTLALVLKKFCMNENGGFSLESFDEAMKHYETLRISRTRDILGSSHKLGASQQSRAESWWYNWLREWTIWIQVQIYGTLPIMFPGATFEYDKAI